MPVSLIIGWFTLGFAVAAVILYGPLMAKAAFQKTMAIKALKEANRVNRETTGQARAIAEVHREAVEAKDGQLESLRQLAALGKEHGELQEEYIAMLKEHNDMAEEYTELLEEHAELQKEYKALLWRAGGGVEGTA